VALYPCWIWFAAACLLTAGGCANLAVHPPTPARTADYAGPRDAAPGERFYVLVFGAECLPPVPRLTHTWATFVRAADPLGEGTPALDAFTISWMPATGDIRPWRLATEPGVNLDLLATVRRALAAGETVAEWGPYECRPELFHRAAAQKAFLEGGGMGYQCVDTVGEAGRTGRGSDCIHAITDMDPDYTRTHYRLIRFGQGAGRYIAHEFGRRGLLIDPERTHDWLNARLGLDAYPIVRKRPWVLIPL
jgi:hypothetical protein